LVTKVLETWIVHISKRQATTNYQIIYK